MARGKAPAMRERSAAEESLGSERGRLAARGLAAMTEGGMEGSELLGGEAKAWEGGVELREGWDVGASRVGGAREAGAYACDEEDARALRRQALPNVWHQRRA